jgi:hypothetical protein
LDGKIITSKQLCLEKWIFTILYQDDLFVALCCNVILLFYFFCSFAASEKMRNFIHGSVQYAITNSVAAAVGRLGESSEMAQLARVSSLPAAA